MLRAASSARNHTRRWRASFRSIAPSAFSSALLPQGRKIVVSYGSIIDRVSQFFDIVGHWAAHTNHTYAAVSFGFAAILAEGMAHQMNRTTSGGNSSAWRCRG